MSVIDVNVTGKMEYTFKRLIYPLLLLPIILVKSQSPLKKVGFNEVCIAASQQVIQNPTVIETQHEPEQLYPVLDFKEIQSSLDKKSKSVTLHNLEEYFGYQVPNLKQRASSEKPQPQDYERELNPNWFRNQLQRMSREISTNDEKEGHKNSYHIKKKSLETTETAIYSFQGDDFTASETVPLIPENQSYSKETSTSNAYSTTEISTSENSSSIKTSSTATDESLSAVDLSLAITSTTTNPITITSVSAFNSETITSTTEPEKKSLASEIVQITTDSEFSKISLTSDLPPITPDPESSTITFSPNLPTITSVPDLITIIYTPEISTINSEPYPTTIPSTSEVTKISAIPDLTTIFTSTIPEISTINSQSDLTTIASSPHLNSISSLNTEIITNNPETVTANFEPDLTTITSIPDLSTIFSLNETLSITLTPEINNSSNSPAIISFVNEISITMSPDVEQSTMTAAQVSFTITHATEISLSTNSFSATDSATMKDSNLEELEFSTIANSYNKQAETIEPLNEVDSVTITSSTDILTSFASPYVTNDSATAFEYANLSQEETNYTLEMENRTIIINSPVSTDISIPTSNNDASENTVATTVSKITDTPTVSTIPPTPIISVMTNSVEEEQQTELMTTLSSEIKVSSTAQFDTTESPAFQSTTPSLLSSSQNSNQPAFSKTLTTDTTPIYTDSSTDRKITEETIASIATTTGKLPDAYLTTESSGSQTGSSSIMNTIEASRSITEISLSSESPTTSFTDLPTILESSIKPLPLTTTNTDLQTTTSESIMMNTVLVSEDASPITFESTSGIQNTVNTESSMINSSPPGSTASSQSITTNSDTPTWITTKVTSPQPILPNTDIPTETTTTTIILSISTEILPTNSEQEKICDDALWLECDSNMARCICKDGMTYDLERGICVSQVGKDCQSGSTDNNTLKERLCIKNAECSQREIGQLGVCKCKDGFLPAENGNCFPGLNSPCSPVQSNSSQSCFAGLKCSSDNDNNSKCVCQDGFTEGKPESHRCFMNYNQKCTLDNINPCNSFRFLNCSEATQECKCQDQTNQIYNEEIKSCIAIAGSSCMTKNDAEGKLLSCIKNASCKNTPEESKRGYERGTCECDEGFENDWKGNCNLKNEGISVILESSVLLYLFHSFIAMLALLNNCL